MTIFALKEKIGQGSSFLQFFLERDRALKRQEELEKMYDKSCKDMNIQKRHDTIYFVDDVNVVC